MHLEAVIDGHAAPESRLAATQVPDTESWGTPVVRAESAAPLTLRVVVTLVRPSVRASSSDSIVAGVRNQY